MTGWIAVELDPNPLWSPGSRKKKIKMVEAPSRYRRDSLPSTAGLGVAVSGGHLMVQGRRVCLECEAMLKGKLMLMFDI